MARSVTSATDHILGDAKVIGFNSSGGGSKWQRVSKSTPCAICGKSDWCIFTGDADAPYAVICSRIESTKRVGTRGAGWLHRLRADDLRDRPRRRRVEINTVAATTIDFTAMAGECYRALGPLRRAALAAEFCVTVHSLERLCVGWSQRHRAFTFPMGDSEGDVRGIRLRSGNGRKWAVPGSKQALSIPRDLPNETPLLLVCEGPTDTAALLDLGFDVIGRPSCTGGNGHLLAVILADHRFTPCEVVIVADADGPGERGAWRMASMLVSYVPTARVIAPPNGIKDAREWKRRGATRLDVLDAIEAAPALQITYGVKAAVR